MPNIDPVFFITPMVVMVFSFGLPIWLKTKTHYRWSILLLALVAYGGAIALKAIVQLLTAQQLVTAFEGNLIAIGLYYGLQTVFFEVGLAYLVLLFANSRRAVEENDAVAYGLGLAMWENGVLLGLLTLINYIIYFVTLSGSGAAADQLYNNLSSTASALFLSPGEAFPLIGYAILERVSSLMVHLSWGYLCVLSVISGRRWLFLAALPMGLIDFFIVFAPQLGTGVFEALIFAIGILCVGASVLLGRRLTPRVDKLPVEGTPTQSG